MPVSVQPASVQPDANANTTSRRALLAGALGGLGALAATAIGRPSVAEGHDVQDVLLGGANAATSLTSITNNTTDNGIFECLSGGGGTALSGISDSGVAVYGNSASNIGVQGYSFTSTGVEGLSNSATGVHGYSQVYGVFAETTSGHALHATATSGGWAGFFEGPVYTTKYQELKEISTPAAPGANHARLFLRDNGLGKTQLCVRFSTGAVKALATQP